MLLAWRIFLLSSFVFFSFASHLAAEGYVSSTLQRIAANSTFEVSPGSYSYHPVRAKSGEIIRVDVQLPQQAYPDISVWVCSEKDFKRYSNRQSNNCRGVAKGQNRITFDHTTQHSDWHYVILDNTYSLFTAKTAHLKATHIFTVNHDLKRQFEGFVDMIVPSLQRIFEFPDFDVTLRPCGQLNAFSEFEGGHITYCSELFFSFIEQQKTGGMVGVLLHELGHSLLNLWDQPNWNNEQTVDEFATVLMIISDQVQAIEEYIQFFEGSDPIQEAAVAVYKSSPHPLSIQRIRNIRQVLANPEEFVRRWNSVLYPNMTDEMLVAIANGDDLQRYGDPALAYRLWKERGN